MDKITLEENKKIIKELLNKNIKRFNNNINDDKYFFRQMRLLNELERKIALEINKEYANHLMKIIEEQTLKIHKFNEAVKNHNFEYINNLSYHELVDVRTIVMPKYYDSINDPYEILTEEADCYLTSIIKQKTEQILLEKNLETSNIKKMPIKEFYQKINDDTLAIDILFASEFID